MNVKAINEAAIKYLEELANGLTPEQTDTGVCENLDKFTRTFAKVDNPNCDYYHVGCIFWEFPSIVAPQWEHFSGSDAWPVEGHDEYYETRQYWDGPYSKKRRQFCQYVADCLKENPLTLEDV